MKGQKLSRRDLLKWMGVGTASVALAACAAPAAPSSAPAGGEEASSEAAPSQEKAKMTIATFAAVLHDWQREFARRWAEAHADEVDLQIEEVVYGEMSKLQLARSASGTLWDVVFSGVKWFPFSASKGMFLALDDFVAARAEDVQMDDFFPAAIANGYLDGTLYGLPYEIHPGNPALVAVNVDYLESKNLPIPDNDWDYMEFTQLAAAATDPDANVWGTDYYPSNYYDFNSLDRAFDTEILDSEGRKFLFNVDERNIEAARWVHSLRMEHNAAVPREMSEGMDFIAGTLATDVTGSYSVNRYNTEIADKFQVKWVLFPKGPDGSRGYTAFLSYFSVYSKTKYPDLAVDLLIYLTSTEAGLWSALEQGTGQPNARKSVWQNEEFLQKSDPIFKDVLNEYFLADIPGSFPMPYNLRFQELQDNWANTIPELFYGDVPFEEGMQSVQEACQEILDLPRA